MPGAALPHIFKSVKLETLGSEVMEIGNGKIKEIRDYHQPLPAKAVQ